MRIHDPFHNWFYAEGTWIDFAIYLVVMLGAALLFY
jgi:hypothetical protein